MESTDLVSSVLSVIPPLSYSCYKGQAGRIGVIGGCRDYTGAPYFAAISALRVGCDLAHVFCTQDAAPVIKSYSPELIVHPILDNPSADKEFSSLFARLHSLVIGPGLGRESAVFDATHKLIELAKSLHLPLVLDADALFYLNKAHSDIYGYKKAILTPNVMEFKRLYEATHNVSLEQGPTQQDVKSLASKLGNVTVVLKGLQDIISDGDSVIVCKEPGSPRRCGGQGDLLSGSMGVFNYWAHSNYKRSCKLESVACNATVVAALGACMLTRKCSNLAFQKMSRSTLTSDMILEIRTAFTFLFPVD